MAQITATSPEFDYDVIHSSEQQQRIMSDMENRIGALEREKNSLNDEIRRCESERATLLNEEQQQDTRIKELEEICRHEKEEMDKLDKELKDLQEQKDLMQIELDQQKEILRKYEVEFDEVSKNIWTST